VAQRPKWIVFDVVETVVSTEPLRARLEQAGLDGALLPVWIARILRDGIALEVTGLWRPFAEVARAALSTLAVEQGRPLRDPSAIVAAFGELPPHPDVRAALEIARDAGVPCALLSILSAETTNAILARANLTTLIGRVISIDELQHWKPLWDVYLHAADRLTVDPDELALLSAHGWDIEGAHQAQLTTGWIQRTEPLSPLVTAPDVSAGSLAEAVERLLALPRGPQLRSPTETLH
jgi:2-haloacid dehalogenase